VTFIVHFDQDSMNPRQEFDHLGTLAILGYGGDEAPDPHNPPHDAILLPVYRYQHSGVAYSTTPFHCPWDSGQTGYIYVYRSTVRKEFNVKRISPKLHDRVLEILRSEVEEFSSWSNGEVYGFTNNETDDSCWGFYGLESLIAEIGDNYEFAQ